MRQSIREARYFLFGQHFAEGLRITFAILLPSLLGSYLGFFESGLTLSLGALCISITDAPGPAIHRRNSMVWGCLGIFIAALVTGFAQLNVYLLGLEIVAGAFFFSMLNVYGIRAAAVGSAAFLSVIMNMDKALTPAQVVPHSLLILGGGAWYLLISLAFSALRPYRLAQQVLGDVLREVAKYLSIKADFYNTRTDLQQNYRRLVAQQIIVNEKQDVTREVLFKTRQIVKDTNTTGRRLVFTFIESVDLFEDVTATYYDYAQLRNRFGDTGILDPISALIHQLAYELERTGFAIQSNRRYQPDTNFDEALLQLKARIDTIGSSQKEPSILLLKKILVNLRRIVKRLREIHRYFGPEAPAVSNASGAPLSRFVGHQPFHLSIFRDNLSFDSAIFRYALRTTLVCAAGFILAKTLSVGQHGYWILLTIAFIMKPGFSLTKERNVQRVIGTLVGATIGVLILVFITNTYILFALLVLFMVLNYSFLRVNYLVMVLSVTPFVLILFHFLGLGYIGVVKERLVDTFIGCAIAFSASYLFLPKWESEQLPTLLSELLEANLHYLQRVLDQLSGLAVSVADHKLVRKEVYVHSANLSAAFQRMLSEPKDKQPNSKQLHQFVVLNHILFSNIASLAASLPKEQKVYPEPMLRAARKAEAHLCEALSSLGRACSLRSHRPAGAADAVTTPDEELLQEQLDFVDNVSTDLAKSVQKLR